MKKIHIHRLFLCLILASSTFASCARTISSDVYHASHVGEASLTYPGVVTAVRTVSVQEHERLEENKLGIAGGAVGGALAGSMIGKGKGNSIATIGGALAGATAGAFAEKALKTQTGIEYVVSLDEGRMTTVVQGPEPVLRVGQRVLVIVGTAGRSRVVASN